MTGPKILLVDDSPIVLMLEAELLRATDLVVVTAASGEAALASVRSEAPRVVVLDIGLPDLSGVEVCRRIKSDPATRHIAVIMSTIEFSEEAMANATAAGADAYLMKPLHASGLRTKIEELLARTSG